MKLLFFCDTVKVLQTCYFKYFDNAWPCPSVLIVSPCRKLWWAKCWNQLLGKFNVSLYEKINFVPHFSLDIAKKQQWDDSVIMTVDRGPLIYKNVQIREAEPSCRWKRSPINYWKVYPDLQKERKIEIGRNIG